MPVPAVAKDKEPSPAAAVAKDKEPSPAAAAPESSSTSQDDSREQQQPKPADKSCASAKDLDFDVSDAKSRSGPLPRLPVMNINVTLPLVRDAASLVSSMNYEKIDDRAGRVLHFMFGDDGIWKQDNQEKMFKLDLSKTKHVHCVLVHDFLYQLDRFFCSPDMRRVQSMQLSQLLPFSDNEPRKIKLHALRIYYTMVVREALCNFASDNLGQYLVSKEGAGGMQALLVNIRAHMNTMGDVLRADFMSVVVERISLSISPFITYEGVGLFASTVMMHMSWKHSPCIIRAKKDVLRMIVNSTGQVVDHTEGEAWLVTTVQSLLVKTPILAVSKVFTARIKRLREWDSVKTPDIF